VEEKKGPTNNQKKMSGIEKGGRSLRDGKNEGKIGDGRETSKGVGGEVRNSNGLKKTVRLLKGGYQEELRGGYVRILIASAGP